MSKLLCWGARPHFLRVTPRTFPQKLVLPKKQRYSWIPPTQYDKPLGQWLNPFWVMRVHWETIPLFATNVVAIFILCRAIVWSFYHKVDIVFKTHSRNNLSRSMNLCCPDIHRYITINQEYKPWPEMQDSLDKMEACEKALSSWVVDLSSW